MIEPGRHYTISGHPIEIVSIALMDAEFIDSLPRKTLVQIVWNVATRDKQGLVLWRYAGTEPWNLDDAMELFDRIEPEVDNGTHGG